MLYARHSPWRIGMEKATQHRPSTRTCNHQFTFSACPTPLHPSPFQTQSPMLNGC
jgi:hypothetical protein